MKLTKIERNADGSTTRKEYEYDDKDYELQSRYERIKNMSIDEMAQFFSERFGCYLCPQSLKECSTLKARPCNEILKDWLKECKL